MFLARHGYGHTIPPHEVNYRANIWALWNKGARGIVSVASVGGIRADLSPGDLVVVQTDFELVHAGWSFSPGPVFVGASGALVQTLPPGAIFAQVVGYALAPTRIRVDVQPPIVLT